MYSYFMFIFIYLDADVDVCQAEDPGTKHSGKSTVERTILPSDHVEGSMNTNIKETVPGR